jgi:CRP/FNR family transcriptional regulator, cyclic AMP receptor protein
MEMEIAAWVASGFVFTTFFMKTMVALRIVAIASNIAFIAYALLGLRYGIFEKVLPIFVLHSMLLPLNVLRLCETKRCPLGAICPLPLTPQPESTTGSRAG